MNDKMTAPTDDKAPVGKRDLIYLFRAYNRGEINLEEWMQRTGEWMEAILARRERQPQPESPAKSGAPD